MKQADLPLPLPQNFQLDLDIKGSHLFIKASCSPKSKPFHLELDSDSIAQITNSLFTDVQSMAQGLKDALNNSYPGLKLSFDNNGKLTYSASFSAGALQKEFSFSLDLIEEASEGSTASLEKKVEELNHEVEELKIQNEKMKLEYDEKITKMEQIISQLEEKIEEIQKASLPLYGKAATPGEVFFNSDSKMASNFKLTDTNKTIQCIKSFSFNYCLECLPKIPLTGKSCYSLKVHKVKGWIHFGITREAISDNWGKNGGWYYYTIKIGTLRADNSEFSANTRAPTGDDNSLIQMIVDMDAGVIVFYVDGYQAQSCQIKKNCNYNVFVSLGSMEDLATLL